MNTSIAGSLESLDQIMIFIEGLTTTEYQYIATPLFESSIGQHLRHIVDLYLALIASSETQGSKSFSPNICNINYDIRRRGACVETDKETGLAELSSIRQWLNSIAEQDINKEALVSTEVSLTYQQSEVFKSSFGRELCFASSHLTHHLAIMAAIAKMSGKDVDPYLGLAPATATYTREQDSKITILSAIHPAQAR